MTLEERLARCNRELEINQNWIAYPFRRKRLGDADYGAIRKRALDYLAKKAGLDTEGIDIQVRTLGAGRVEFIAVPGSLP